MGNINLPGICQNHYKDLVYLTYSGLNQLSGIIHGCSTRLGGISQGCFASLNLGFKTGDEKSLINENYSRLAQAMGIPIDSLTLSQQTHTANIRIVKENDRGKGLTKPCDYQDIDALITDIPDICLVINHGDCVPLLFADINLKAIGAAHAGWRGTVADIAGKTIKAMEESYKIKPENIIAAIGPCIGPCCYEVGAEVADAFAQLPNSNAFLDFSQGNKAKVNLALANYHLLLEAGLKKEHIQLASPCTACNNELFFSHRKQMGKRGILASLIYIKP